MHITKILSHCLSLILTFSSFQLYGQDLINDASAELTAGSPDEVFTETVNIISRSGKIFILSNSNQLLNKGDFFTLVLRDKGPVARAVVAKTHAEQAGVKILKVYSLSRWKMLNKGLSVDLMKGDDSSLFVAKKDAPAESAAEESKIDSAEDLFNDKAIVDDDLSDFYKDSRVIKPDNIVAVAYNQLRFVEKFENNTETGNQFNISWARQFSDNYWAEGLFGTTTVNGYPVSGSQTIISNFTGRLKYSFKAPLYSYIFPYIGFQTVSVSSPDAGVVDTGTSQAQADAELETIDDIERTSLIGGVTVLRRLVPGWFLKLDLGTDFGTTFFNVGFGIEF